MKKIVIALSIAIIAAIAFAQEPRHRVFVHSMEGDSAACASSLGLNADQKTQWDAIHQQLQASVKPLHDQHRAAEQQLHALAESSSPDATAVGSQFLAMRTIDKQIFAAHESAKQKIAAILTPDQKSKLDAIHEGMEHGDQGPAMMRVHHSECSRD